MLSNNEQRLIICIFSTKARTLPAIIHKALKNDIYSHEKNIYRAIKDLKIKHILQEEKQDCYFTFKGELLAMVLKHFQEDGQND